MGDFPVKKSDSEWQAILSPEQVSVDQAFQKQQLVHRGAELGYHRSTF
jgi:hypothetical protein